QAAAKAELPAVAVRTGGYSVDELREAGAVAVHEHVGVYASIDQALRARLAATEG
ncbi:HAD family hydrolase, partial [Kineococcus sp. T90]|nr:HAD family hydrolase [Kineococcus indalonis]